MVFAISLFLLIYLSVGVSKCQIFCETHTPRQTEFQFDDLFGPQSHPTSVVNIPSFIEKTTPLKWVGLGWEKPPKMAPKNLVLISWSSTHGRYIRPCSEDIMSYNSAISACEKAMEWRVALQLLEDTCGTVDGSEILLPSHPMACSRL